MKQTLYPALAVLLVDDDQTWLESFSFSLSCSGLNNVLTCRDSRKVLDILARQDIGVVVLDLMMPHFSGEDLLTSIHGQAPNIPVIIISGLDQVATAVQCVKMGAHDYFVKTDERDKLITGVRRAVELRELRQECTRLKSHFLKETPDHPEAFSEIVTQNRQMNSIFRYVEAVKSSQRPVLITGETGTGKELLARSLYRLSGLKGYFVAVNVAGLDDHVFSDTLFGHKKGAFTGAQYARDGLVAKAENGFLFLDEIGDLSKESQVKLLRLVQEREYLPLGSDIPKRTNARIVTATQADVSPCRDNNSFRQDLFYRLSTHSIYIPALRERLDDLPLLVRHLLDKAAKDLGKAVPEVLESIYSLLSTYAFPGNVRELETMIFDVMAKNESGELPLESFRSKLRAGEHAPFSGSTTWADSRLLSPGTLPTLKEASRLLVAEALKRAEGNQSLAAGMLGISRQALNKRVKDMQTS